MGRRTTWRTSGLAELMRDSEPVQSAVNAQLQRRLTHGAWLGALAGELEAGLVHERTPPASPEASGRAPTPEVVG